MARGIINIESNIAAFTRELDKLAQDLVPKATAMTLNRLADTAKSRFVKEMTPVMGVAQKDLRSRIGVSRASPKYLTSVVYPLKRFAFRLAHFKPRQTKRGVTATAWGKRKLYRRTFLAKVSYGVGDSSGSITGVFVRKSRKRLPIKQLYGPSVGRTFAQEKIVHIISTVILERADKEFVSAMNYQLRRNGFNDLR